MRKCFDSGYFSSGNFSKFLLLLLLSRTELFFVVRFECVIVLERSVRTVALSFFFAAELFLLTEGWMQYCPSVRIDFFFSSGFEIPCSLSPDFRRFCSGGRYVFLLFSLQCNFQGIFNPAPLHLPLLRRSAAFRWGIRQPIRAFSFFVDIIAFLTFYGVCERLQSMWASECSCE